MGAQARRSTAIRRLVLAPGNMDDIYPNAFAIASQFAQMDNYYIDAEQSIQGHTWTVFGRSTDYAERRWLNIWGRGQFGVTYEPGVGDETDAGRGQPLRVPRQERRAAATTRASSSAASPDARHPLARRHHRRHHPRHARRLLRGRRDARDVRPDGLHLQRGCQRPHLRPRQRAGRTRRSSSRPTTRARACSSTALSHSPFWADSLIIVVEDDPSRGRRSRRRPPVDRVLRLAVDQAQLREPRALPPVVDPQAHLATSSASRTATTRSRTRRCRSTCSRRRPTTRRSRTCRASGPISSCNPKRHERLEGRRALGLHRARRPARARRQVWEALHALK